MRKILLPFLFLASMSYAQTGAVQGFATLGGVPAKVQGTNSTNTLQGIVPNALITVYLTGTTTKATIYSSSTGTPLSNPFTANPSNATNPGGWIFYAATNQALDIFGSGGICPNCYVVSTPLGISVFPSSSISVVTGVISFNGRSGAVSLLASDVNSVGNITNSTSGNAATATALAALPTPCSSGNYFLGILANGNSTGCTPLPFGSLTTLGTSGVATLIAGVLNIPNYGAGASGVTSFNTRTGAVTLSTADVNAVGTITNSTSGNAATATALAGTPTLCSTGNAPTGVLANGNATGCAAIGTGGLSGMTAGQIPVAATATTVTSSKALAGSGTGIVTGPTSSTSGDAVIYTGTSGQTADAGFAPGPALAPCSDESSTFTPVTGNCYFVTASVSTATPGSGAFVIFNVTTSSAGSLALTGTTIADGGNCASYISGTTLTLPSSQSMSVKSDGTTIRATCTVATSGGVSSLNALTGALSLTSTGGTISISPSGTNIDIESTGGGGVPLTTVLVGGGDSKWDDDSNAISPTIALSAWTCATGTCIVTNTGSNGFSAGDWVNMRFSSAWTSTFTAPTDITLSTGYTLFKVIATGLSSTQFEFNFASSGTCASTCGNAAKATYNLAFNINNILGLAANPNVIIPNPVTMQALNTDYTTILHPLSEAVTGLPTYFVLGDFEDDVLASSAGCNSAATIEAAMQSLWAKIHTDTSKVVVWSSTAFSGNQTGIGICTSAYQTLIALEQWLPLQGKSAANQTSGQYWDLFADAGRIVNDPLNTSLVASNGGFTAGSVNLVASNIARVLRTGVSDPLDKRPQYFGAGPSQGSAANGFVDVPATDAINYLQIWDSAMANLVLRVGTQSGFQGIQVGGSGSSSGTLQASSNMTCSLGTCNVPMVISGSGTGGGRIATFTAPSTTTSNAVSLRLGITPQNGSGTAANDNNLDITFNYVGNNSTSNNAVFALTNATNGLKLDGSGNFFIQSIGSSTSPLCTTTGGQVTNSGCVTGGTTTNALTMNNSGSGVASGTTFDGSAARVLSYNTLGAAPLASPTFTGTPAAPTATGGTNTTQLATTAFVQAAIAAAGTGAGIVTYSGPSLTFTGTLFFPIGGGGLSSTTETNVDIDAPAAVTIQNMTVQMSIAPGVGNSITYTWRKNASSQTLTCTISGASATSCSDTTHNFTTAALDLLDIQVVTTGTVVGTPTVVMAAQVGISAPGTTTFSNLTNGTNTSAAMVIGSGASMSVSGTGTIAATSVGGITITGTPSTGMVPTATSSSAATWQTPASASALVLISSQILGSPAATFTFSSIPGTYTNLELKCEGRGSNASANIGVSIQFNGDTGANYDLGTLQASNGSVTSSSTFGGASVNVGNMPGSSATANYSGGFNASIHYYTNTTFFKHVLVDGSFMSSATGTAYFIQKFDNWWRSTSAITSLTVNTSAGNFVTGSVCNLYGVL